MPLGETHPMTIGKVAELAGVTKRTLHNWFYSGKIPEVDRDRNNYRVFDEKEIAAILSYAKKRTVAPHKLQRQLFEQKEK